MHSENFFVGMETSRFPRIFITVGTTRFDDLMDVVDTNTFQTLLFNTLHTRDLIIQYGNGAIVPKSMQIPVFIVLSSS